MLDYPLDLLARVLRVEGAEGAEGAEGVAPFQGQVSRVTTDSRGARPGDLFFAIPGERFDGHQFVTAALEQGAVAAVADPRRLPGKNPGTVLGVPDPLAALGALARWHRRRQPARVIAITGSVGKTTTKDLVAAAFGARWKTLKSPASFNNESGLPLTLLQIEPLHEVAVVEMAMRGPGQIRYLAEIAGPDAALITNIGLSHLELLGTQDAIAEAKAEVLDYLPVGGPAILPSEDDYYPFLASRIPGGAPLHAFGFSGNGVTGRYLGPRPGEGAAGALGAAFEVQMPDGETGEGWIPLPGRHNVCNALAAVAAAAAFDTPLSDILAGLRQAEVSQMRMAVHRLAGDVLLLDDAYNASSPQAMLGALEVLQETPGGRRLAVLGDMLELGSASETAHREVGEAAGDAGLSLLLTVGERAAEMAASAVERGLAPERTVRCRSTEEAVRALRERLQPRDVVLVKGSRGMAMERIVQSLVNEGGA
jgi:UDP-N-acetylmuramoyl-tripeptide--D-alanyl-D-alanine ligase